MNSIRTRLLMATGTVFCALCVLAGVSTYYAFRAGLIAGIQRDGATMARQARMWQMRGRTDVIPGFEEDSGVFWQVWPETGRALKYPDGVEGFVEARMTI